MKHYLVLAFDSRESQSPSKKMVLHGDATFQQEMADIVEQYAYIVVEFLSDPD